MATLASGFHPRSALPTPASRSEELPRPSTDLAGPSEGALATKQFQRSFRSLPRRTHVSNLSVRPQTPTTPNVGVVSDGLSPIDNPAPSNDNGSFRRSHIPGPLAENAAGRSNEPSDVSGTVAGAVARSSQCKSTANSSLSPAGPPFTGRRPPTPPLNQTSPRCLRPVPTSRGESSERMVGRAGRPYSLDGSITLPIRTKGPRTSLDCPLEGIRSPERPLSPTNGRSINYSLPRYTRISSRWSQKSSAVSDAASAVATDVMEKGLKSKTTASPQAPTSVTDVCPPPGSPNMAAILAEAAAAADAVEAATVQCQDRQVDIKSFPTCSPYAGTILLPLSDLEEMSQPLAAGAGGSGRVTPLAEHEPKAPAPTPVESIPGDSDKAVAAKEERAILDGVTAELERRPTPSSRAARDRTSLAISVARTPISDDEGDGTGDGREPAVDNRFIKGKALDAGDRMNGVEDMALSEPATPSCVASAPRNSSRVSLLRPQLVPDGVMSPLQLSGQLNDADEPKVQPVQSKEGDGKTTTQQEDLSLDGADASASDTAVAVSDKQSLTGCSGDGPAASSVRCSTSLTVNNLTFSREQSHGGKLSHSTTTVQLTLPPAASSTEQPQPSLAVASHGRSSQSTFLSTIRGVRQKSFIPRSVSVGMGIFGSTASSRGSAQRPGGGLTSSGIMVPETNNNNGFGTRLQRLRARVLSLRRMFGRAAGRTTRDKAMSPDKDGVGVSSADTNKLMPPRPSIDTRVSEREAYSCLGVVPENIYGNTHAYHVTTGNTDALKSATCPPQFLHLSSNLHRHRGSLRRGILRSCLFDGAIDKEQPAAADTAGSPLTTVPSQRSHHRQRHRELEDAQAADRCPCVKFASPSRDTVGDEKAAAQTLWAAMRDGKRMTSIVSRPAGP